MKLLTLFLLLITTAGIGQSSYDLLILNGRIVDGTGNSWYYADLGIKGDKIVAIGKLANKTATKTIDAKGLIVAPGFIDVHGHIEGGIIGRPSADNYIFDGVTTVVTGNCGGSASDITEFFRRVDSVKPSINVATLIGHNTVRAAIMGRDNKQPTAAEQQKMEELVERFMKEGAVGLSTGLIYVPGTYAKTEEVIGLAKAATKYDGIYASHIRNEESGVADAIEEALNIGRQANIPVQISHFKVGGKSNWGRSKETVAMIERARKDGWDVTIDQYPYTASSTNLGVRLPNWAIAGTQDSINSRINNPTLRKQIIQEMLAEIRRYKFKNYGFAVVASYGADSSYNGKSISDINKLMGRKPKATQEAETILDMIGKGGAQMVYHSMNEDDVRYIMKYPFNMTGADAGVPTPGRGMPHPRAYGTNSRILAKYVREEKIISLEEAIRRMTSLAAQKFRLKDRGLLKEGMSADIVIFDEMAVADKATFDNPHQYSIGFKFIIVNGQLTVDNSSTTGVRGGRVLYGPGFVSSN
ncbi:MAG: D-aminoacylase [Chitinophagaceae bacterium]|nr:D-aminoacylase [Chitinophagaceae bacterium]